MSGSQNFSIEESVIFSLSVSTVLLEKRRLSSFGKMMILAMGKFDERHVPYEIHY